MSLNLAYNNALTALDANQKAIAIHSDNIANSSNQNYKKRSTVLNSNGSVEIDNLTFGSGVKVASINREFNLVLETNLLNSQSQYGYTASYAYYLNNLENFTSPNGKNLLGDSMTKLQSTLNSALNDLDNEGARIELFYALQDVGNTANDQYSEIMKIRNGLLDSSGNGEISKNITSFNNSLEKLQKINKDLEKSAIKGVDRNDLLDQRDALLKDISDVVQIDVKYNVNGTVNVSMPAEVASNSESILLVDATNTTKPAEKITLGTTTSATSGLKVPNFTLSDGRVVDLSGNKGNLTGMVESVKYMDKKLLDVYKFSKSFSDELNKVAYNAYSENGATNKNIFKAMVAIPPLPEAENIVEFLIPDQDALPLWSDLDKIGGADATVIKQYQDALNSEVTGTNYDLKGFSNESLTELTIDVKKANDDKNSASNTKTLYQNAVYDYSSVDVNKEMAELMNVQNSFEAAATLMNTVNKMVNSAINMVN